MIGTERFLPHRQRSLDERLGVGVATLTAVEQSLLLSDGTTSGRLGPRVFSPIASDRL
jgi:hypothetical protein